MTAACASSKLPHVSGSVGDAASPVRGLSGTLSLEAQTHWRYDLSSAGVLLITETLAQQRLDDAPPLAQAMHCLAPPQRRAGGRRALLVVLADFRVLRRRRISRRIDLLARR